MSKKFFLYVKFSRSSGKIKKGINYSLTVEPFIVFNDVNSTVTSLFFFFSFNLSRDLSGIPKFFPFSVVFRVGRPVSPTTRTHSRWILPELYRVGLPRPGQLPSPPRGESDSFTDDLSSGTSFSSPLTQVIEGTCFTWRCTPVKPAFGTRQTTDRRPSRRTRNIGVP